MPGVGARGQNLGHIENVLFTVTGYRYIAHLYCLAVQAGFYSDVVECSLSTRENLV